jgi:hypothetical protein
MAAEPRFTRPGTSLETLDAAWNDRLREATVLRLASCYAASIVFGVYAIEIYLKCRICRKLGLRLLPKAFEIHDLESLLLLSGLSSKIQAKAAVQVQKNWSQVVQVSERINEMRYSPGERWTEGDAAEFFAQILESPHAVLPWLEKQR